MKNIFASSGLAFEYVQTTNPQIRAIDKILSKA